MLWWVDQTDYYQLCWKRTSFGQGQRLNQICKKFVIKRPFNHTKLCMSHRLLSGWEGHSKPNKRKKTWRQKLAHWDHRLRKLKIKLINWKIRSMRWRKKIRKSNNKASKLIRMMLKPRRGRIKFLRKSWKSFCKGHNKKNDCKNVSVFKYLITFL